MNAVVMSSSDRRHSPGGERVDGNSDTIRVASWDVVRTDATHFAEEVICDASPESIRSQRFLASE